MNALDAKIAPRFVKFSKSQARNRVLITNPDVIRKEQLLGGIEDGSNTSSYVKTGVITPLWVL